MSEFGTGCTYLPTGSLFVNFSFAQEIKSTFALLALTLPSLTSAGEPISYLLLTRQDTNVSTLHFIRFPDQNYFRPHNLTSKHSLEMIRPQAITQCWRAHPFIFFYLNGILIVLYLIKKRRRVSVFFSFFSFYFSIQIPALQT